MAETVASGAFQSNAREIQSSLWCGCLRSGRLQSSSSFSDASITAVANWEEEKATAEAVASGFRSNAKEKTVAAA